MPEMVGKPVARTSEDTLRVFARLLALTSSREPLVVLLDELLRFAEQLTPEMRCSILLADLSAGGLRSGAAPRFSPGYTKTNYGFAVAGGGGSRGPAGGRRQKGGGSGNLQS